jgi:hypothetical protein
MVNAVDDGWVSHRWSHATTDETVLVKKQKSSLRKTNDELSNSVNSEQKESTIKLPWKESATVAIGDDVYSVNEGWVVQKSTSERGYVGTECERIEVNTSSMLCVLHWKDQINRNEYAWECLEYIRF